jgi:hypothetical protein
MQLLCPFVLSAMRLAVVSFFAGKSLDATNDSM